MLLSDLIDSRVVDSADEHVGSVIDVRMNADEPSAAGRIVVYGLIVSPRSGSSLLGYERNDEHAPWAIDRILRWRHRDAFLVLWGQVAIVRVHEVQLQPDFVRYSPILQT